MHDDYIEDDGIPCGRCSMNPCECDNPNFGYCEWCGHASSDIPNHSVHCIHNPLNEEEEEHDSGICVNCNQSLGNSFRVIIDKPVCLDCVEQILETYVEENC